jgi:7,8-dihydropterin-6-yl-methyl-4-(beta-D-ribofuranosyl)aminobenzene 5'-phosphate synthase
MITLCCIVDNTAQHGSSLWGEHGVSFVIETPDGQVLFDTGQSGDVLVHNSALMNIQLDQVDAIALSHAHYDHTGGLEQLMTFAKQGTPLYGNPDLFRERFETKDGNSNSIGMRLSREQIDKHLAVRLSAAPTEILPGVWTTGEITNRSKFEGSTPNHFVQKNGEWLPDPYQDDLSLVLETSNGLVVVCGCCHAGLLNTLAHVQLTFQKDISAIVGGIHLVSTASVNLEHATAVLKDYSNRKHIKMFLNHCTGPHAHHMLVNAFGDWVSLCPAGTVLSFV